MLDEKNRAIIERIAKHADRFTYWLIVVTSLGFAYFTGL